MSLGKRDRDPRQLVGIQCKLKSDGTKLSEKEVTDELAKTLLYKPKLTEYFVVTTSKDDTVLDQLGQQLSRNQEASGRKIHIEIWGWDTLSERINQSRAAKEAFDPGFSPSLAAQNQKLDAVLEGQRATRAQVAALATSVQRASTDLPTKFPPQLADRELKEALSRALRRRGFVGTDISAELAVLADRAIDGELSLGSNTIRAEICDRAARSNISLRGGEVSRRFRDEAAQLDPNRDLFIANALLKEAEGDTDGALRDLRSRNSSEARGAVFSTLVRQRGAEPALKWARSESLGAADLNAPGALNLILTEIGNAEFEQALGSISRVPESYFDQCPALHLIRAQLTLASILPVDQKAALFQGLPMNPKTMQLASGPVREEKIAAADADLQRLLRVLDELGLSHLERSLSEFDLWLRLERATTREAARIQLAAEIADPEKTLQRVRLALAYDIPFNREALERHLAGRKEFGGWTPDERHAAFLMAYRSSDPKRMADFFDKYHDDLFSETDLAHGALAGIEIEALARTGRLEDARRHITLHREHDHFTGEQASELDEIVAHIEKGDEVENLRQRYSQSQSLTDLRLLIGALRAHRDLKQLADYAPRLARVTKTIEDFDLATRSFIETDRQSELLELMEELPDLQKLNDDYSAAKGWAFYKLGRVMEARGIARGLMARRTVASDRELAVNTAIETGDWGYLQAILAREASRAEILPAADIARLARLALEANSPYVDQFRDAALSKAPDDPEINIAAYTLAIERGAEYQGSQAHGWFQKAIAQSGADGPVRAVSMRELVDQAPSWNKHRENVDQMLRQGNIPLFLAAKSVRRQVIDLTLGQALRNTDPNDPRMKYPVFAFSGAQPERDVTGAKSAALDVTCLVTLDYLGLLEKAFAQFDRIVIAPRTLSMLFLERQFLKFHQPSEMAKAQRLQTLIAAGCLSVAPVESAPDAGRSKAIGTKLTELISAAERDGGLVVRSAPVLKLGSFLEERVNMSPYKSVLTDTLAVLSFLSTNGKIDSEIKERAEAYLRQADEGWEAAVSINSQSKLYLDDLSVNYLDHVGLLGTLTRSVSSVFVHSDLDSQTRNLLRYGKHADELLSAIERIRATVGAQIEAGRIQFSARHAGDEGLTNEKDDILESAPTLDLMSDLVGIDVVVADDRSLNKLPTWTDGSGRNAAVTSSLGILVALKNGGQIDDQSYWRARHRLRAAGYYAAPVEPPEILHHLASASIIDGEVRETPELKAVRESFALPQINQAFVVGEEQWLNRVRYAVYKAIHELWLKTPDLDRAQALADWLLSILPSPLEWCLQPEIDAVWAAARQQVAVQTGLMMIFINSSHERRNRYFAWLQDAVIEPLQEKHADIWDATLEFLKLYVTRVIEGNNENRAGCP